jgi:hypothetical protein
LEDFGDIPVGLTIFDTWMTKLFIVMVVAKFIDLTDIGTLDREHWKQYFDMEYTPQEAFEEDLTCYGD